MIHETCGGDDNDDAVTKRGARAGGEAEDARGMGQGALVVYVCLN